MHKHAQDILSSHKNAAARAAAWLKASNNINLKQTDALELVAQVLGVANWQTLSGLAKQGKGPRVGAVDAAAPPVAAPAMASPPVTPIDEIVRRLEEHYARRGPTSFDLHPLYTLNDWRQACRESGESTPYWHWVCRTLTEKKAMMPWEHVNWLEWQICDAAGMYLDDFDVDEGWAMSNSRYPELLSERKFSTEIEAWRNTAEIAILYMLRFHKLSREQWEGFDDDNKVLHVSRAFRRPANDRPRTNRLFDVGDAVYIPRLRKMAKVDLVGTGGINEPDYCVAVPLSQQSGSGQAFDRRGFHQDELVFSELVPLLFDDARRRSGR